MRILVIDDHAARREVVLEQLSTLGYGTTAVQSGLEAIQQLLTKKFNLVLIDAALSNIDGFDATSCVRRIERLTREQGIPLIATNRLSDEENGFDDILEQPISKTKLEQTLDRWLKQGKFKERLVLVVEDHETNRKVLSLLLERMGVAHHFAKDGVESLDMVRKNGYALILMDILMPHLDGLMATKAIRASANRGKDVPIVAITAQAMDGDMEKCIWAGMNDYLPKPYTKEELESIISRWLK